MECAQLFDIPFRRIRQLWKGGSVSLKEGCHLLDTLWFSRFLQQQPHHNVSLCSIFRYSGPGTRIPKLALFCHRKWFASLFWVLVILPINLTSSSQFWRKLLFFLRRVTYFVLAKQIWIPYDQNTIFSFVEFPYEGKKLAVYAEKRVCTIYLHMETLAKSWS